MAEDAARELPNLAPEDAVTGITLHIIGDVRRGRGVIWELEVWPTSRFGAESSKLPPLGALRLGR